MQKLLNPENIPLELKALPQWVNWRLEDRGNGKMAKPPVDPKTGSKASTNNSNTWATYDQALEYYEEFKESGCRGLGFVFTKSDPYVGIDLDGCRDPETGDIEPWAQEIVQDFNSYTEVSVSGTGLHIIVKRELPSAGINKGGIEMYDDRHYFTMTGCLLPGTNSTIEDRQEMVLDLYSRLQDKQTAHFVDLGVEKHPGKASKGNLKALTAELEQAELTPAGKEILWQLETGRHGERYQKLYQGDWKGAGYPSQSEADMAMFNFLYKRTGGKAGLVYAIIQETELGKRDKMKRPDYAARSIQAAIDSKDWRPDGQELRQHPKPQVVPKQQPEEPPADEAWSPALACIPHPHHCGPIMEKVKDVHNPKPSGVGGPTDGLGDRAISQSLNNTIPLYRDKDVRVTTPVAAPEADNPETRMAELILEFARSTGDPFNCDKIVTSVTRCDGFKVDLSDKKKMERLKSTIRKNLSRLTEPTKKNPVPLLEALGKGYYRYRAEDIAAAKAAEVNRAAQLRAALRNKYRMKTFETEGKPVNMSWPLGLEKIVHLFPGSLVVISGVTNTGKTTLGLELVLKGRVNSEFTEVTYFNSEMSEDELLDRQRDYEEHYNLPKGTFAKKVNFIKPESMNALEPQAMDELAKMIGPNDLNVLDYLTIHDQFYKVGGALELLSSRLDKGILVVFLQKDPEKERGLGGIFNLALTRLAFTLDFDQEESLRVLRFQKVKKPTVRGSRPEDTEILFDLNPERTELIFKGKRTRRTKLNDGKPAGKAKAIKN